MDIHHVEQELQTFRSSYPKSYLILYPTEFQTFGELVKLKANGRNVPVEKILNAFEKIGDPPFDRRSSKYLSAKSRLTSEIFYHKTHKKKQGESNFEKSGTEEKSQTKSDASITIAQTTKHHNNWPPCDIDESHGPSEWKCLHCEDHMCASCTDTHRKGKRTREHRLLHKDEKSKEDKLMKELYCSIHEGMELDRYCKDDEKSICVECFVKSHSKHNVISMDAIANETRSLVGKSLVTVDQAIPKYETMIQNLEEKLVEAENQSRENCKTITLVSEKVVKRIKEKSKTMKAKEEKYLKSLKESIVTKSIGLKNIKEEMENAALASRRFLETCNNRTLKNEALGFIKLLRFEKPDYNFTEVEGISRELTQKEIEKELLS